MTIDAHFHYIPEFYLKYISEPNNPFQDVLTKTGEGYRISNAAGFSYPVEKNFYQRSAIVSRMDQMELDQVMLSISPSLFHYEMEPQAGADFCRKVNLDMLEFSAEYPGRIIPTGTVPLQDIPLAIEELRFCHSQGIKAIQISCRMPGKSFDDSLFLPFFLECERLHMTILFHPGNLHLENGILSNYYLSNVFGCPLETSLLVAAFIFGGVLDKVPNLKIILCHSGGFIPYIIGRMKHGYEVRPEPKIHGAKSPELYMKHFYFDTLLFEPKQLSFLIDYVGADHVVVGTDHGFDMGMYQPVDFVRQMQLSAQDENKILSENLLNLLQA